MTTSRLSLVNPLRTRPGDYSKDARMVNAYPDESRGSPIVRKRPAAKSLGGAAIGPGAQLLGNLLEAHVGIVGAGGELVTINETSTSSAANFTSATKTTGANCTSVTPNVSFLSVRGQGNGTWMYRSVRWRVEYYNGSTWVSGSFRIVNMGAQSATPVTDTVTYTFTGAGVWQWRIYAEAYDTDGTTWGSVTYSYSQETVTSANVGPTNYFPTFTTGYAIYPTYGAPVGTAEIYQITYTATPQIRVQLSNAGGTSSLGTSIATGYTSGTHKQLDISNNHVNALGQQLAANKLANRFTGLLVGTWSTWSPGAVSHTVSGSSLTFNNKFWSLGTGITGTTSTYTTAELTLSSISATIYRRTVTSSNSTTASNTYTVVSYSEAYTVDNSASSITDATKALITVVNDDASIYDLTLLP